MSARKPSFTAADVAALQPLAVRCIVAAVEQADAAEAWRVTRGFEPDLAAICRRSEDARDATGHAGKAFADALRKIQGAK